MDFYKGTIPIIDDATSESDIYEAMRDRELAGDIPYMTGLIPRDYAEFPRTMFDPPSQIKTYSESEWDALYDEEEELQSSLEHLYLQGRDQPVFVNLDQNGDGYCWAYSTGHAIMLERLRANQPLIRINPHATAAIIKRGRNEGGWCGLSGAWATEHGYAVQGTGPGEWPEHSRDLKHDTPALRAAMKLHRVEENWIDLSADVYDRKLSKLQYATALFMRHPCPSDYNHWGHSVCAMRWVRIERGSWGELILNSWKGWGRFGLAVMRGSKSFPNSSISIRTTTPSPV